MLATAAQKLPRGDGWSYEFKWDGVRVLADVTGRGVRLSSRAENEVTAAYPEVVTSLKDSPDALLDGEVVAFVDGVPSFEALQARMHVRAKAEARALAETTPATFVVFDLLRLDGTDLTRQPYARRRELLQAWAEAHGTGAITLSPTFDDGPATQTAAQQHGLEGVVAKRSSSRYLAGGRSADWQKLRFVRTGDFAVIGTEAPANGSQELSSLVLGYRDGAGELVFAGKVGSGVSGAVARAIDSQLVHVGRCVLAEIPPASPGRVVSWVEPTLVVEVEFTAWTGEGRLRHPVFRRLRTDKSVDEAEGDR